MDTGHHSKVPAILAGVFGVLFLFTLIFGIWAFSGMQENQSNLDAKIKAASDVAVKAAEEAKEAEFVERDKNPYRTYTGSETYGSLTFDYPKSWSVLAASDDRNTLLDFYAHPYVIPGTGEEIAFGLRAEILDSSYDSELSSFERDIEAGIVKSKAYRPEKVSSVLGSYLEGEILREKTGRMIMLPLRDKTIKIWTESPDYYNDFENVIKSVSFIP